jgi:dipeptidyl aminopeptidase/acylaminoacyl peptidase
MKYTNSLLCFSFCIQFVYAQHSSISKPFIDSAAINHWPSLGGARAISNDGKYFMYSVDNDPVGSNILIIRSTEGSWQKEFVGISSGVFSGDSKEFIFQNADTLFFLSLDKKAELKKITGVASYNQPANVKGRWLVYQLNNENKELVIYDFTTNQERHFDHVIGYVIDDAITKILITTSAGLEVANLKEAEVMQIWSSKDHLGSSIGGFTLDKSGTQVCFLTAEEKDNIKVNTIWYFKEGMKHAEEKVTDRSKGVEEGLKVASSEPKFSDDGYVISFYLTKKGQISKPSANAVSVDIWNWKDSTLQGEQLVDDSWPDLFLAAIGIQDEKVIRLTYDNENVPAALDQGDYVVVTKNNNPGDRFWLDKLDSAWLVLVIDGSRMSLPSAPNALYYVYFFSPDGRYLIFFQAGQQGSLFSVDLNTKQVRNISLGVPAGALFLNHGFDYLERNLLDTIRFNNGIVGVAGWEPSDTALLVYDNFDIWKLSLNGTYAPVNISHGYGRQHHIRLRVADENDGTKIIYTQRNTLLLVAFNTENKYNGFYQLALSGKSDPVLLSMGPWTIYHKDGMINSNTNEFDNAGMPPLKATNADSWVVLRTTATEAPNYFLTDDFKTYKPLTDFQPQKKYNWLTSELISWTQPDGITTQGVLYKPEDFDLHKKYPVIIQYYQQLSHRVYEYPQPEYTGSAHINIPWFVSRGYLVFTPDIYYHQFQIGQSATNTVESAGRMLSKLPYVDSLRMGIAGHSFGGAETNYIVTHTHLFAAALSGAAGHDGVDLISNSLAIANWGGIVRNDLVRYERDDVGATLWQRPELWINHSPIFRADQVTTPFLIFYNKADGGNDRAIELFIALRRLEKPTWMLQYDNGGHSVDGKDAEDFTIRATQFFDHFLKGAHMPVWMSKGIPARLKGVDNGLSLDTDKSQFISEQNVQNKD